MRVYDRLDTKDTDPFYPTSRVTNAINLALMEAVDELAMTVARQRWMKRIADVSSVSGATGTWDEPTLTWTLPADFRRPWILQRDNTDLFPVDEKDFAAYGGDGFLILGNQMLFTEGTISEGIECFYIYKPATLSGDSDTPDFIEGYEEFLAIRAAMSLIIKGDTGDPSSMREEAKSIWHSLIKGARRSPLPASIRKNRGANGENWYG